MSVEGKVSCLFPYTVDSSLYAPEGGVGGWYVHLGSPGVTLDFTVGPSSVYGEPFQHVVAGQPCTVGSPSFVAMSLDSYNAMINGFAVNETLSVGLVALMAALGLALGYYVFGPRRRSVVDISS